MWIYSGKRNTKLWHNPYTYSTYTYCSNPNCTYTYCSNPNCSYTKRTYTKRTYTFSSNSLVLYN